MLQIPDHGDRTIKFSIMLAQDGLVGNKIGK